MALLATMMRGSCLSEWFVERVGNEMSDAFSRLQDLLGQLFQFESKELDFGVYRIMNHKRGEIERFIHNGLADTVEEALRGGVVARQSA